MSGAGAAAGDEEGDLFCMCGVSFSIFVPSYYCLLCLIGCLLESLD